jgi:hypothetical protein
MPPRTKNAGEKQDLKRKRREPKQARLRYRWEHAFSHTQLEVGDYGCPFQPQIRTYRSCHKLIYTLLRLSLASLREGSQTSCEEGKNF